MGYKEPYTRIGKDELQKHFNNFKKTLTGFLNPGDGAIITHEVLHISGVYYDGQPCVFLPPTLITCEGDTYFISGECTYRHNETGELCTGILMACEAHRFTEAKFVESLDEVEVDNE